MVSLGGYIIGIASQPGKPHALGIIQRSEVVQ